MLLLFVYNLQPFLGKTIYPSSGKIFVGKVCWKQQLPGPSNRCFWDAFGYTAPESICWKVLVDIKGRGLLWVAES